MPRKKKVAQLEKEPPKVDPAFVDADGYTRLPPLEMWQWRALDAELQRFTLETRVATNEFDALVEQNPTLKLLRVKIAESKASLERSGAEYRDWKAKVEKAIGTELQKCTIDDRTGLIHRLEDL